MQDTRKTQMETPTQFDSGSDHTNSAPFLYFYIYLRKMSSYKRAKGLKHGEIDTSVEARGHSWKQPQDVTYPSLTLTQTHINTHTHTFTHTHSRSDTFTQTHESIPNFVKLSAHIKNQPRATLRACVTPPKAAESKKFKLSNY